MTDPKYRLDWMISVDDHVLEPPNVWQDRVPARYKDAAPKIVVRNGVENWRYEGRFFPTSGLSAIASLNCPSFPRFAGQTFMEGQDSALGEMCIRAWNDWMLDEWCATAPGRFIPGTLVPFWDIDATVREVLRCAEKGSKAV